jgi:hypothetical protein
MHITAQTNEIHPTIKLESWILIPESSDHLHNEIFSGTDLFFRRIRFGANGKIARQINYNISLAGDRWGIDANSPEGGKHKGIFLWNAYLSGKIFSSNDLLFLHAGYLPTTVSRESNTSTWFVSSFDKAYTDGILRKFISGKFNGIESGIAFGGNYHLTYTGFMYRVGLHFPEKYSFTGYQNPLFTGRVVFIAGEPEQKFYKYMLSGNPYYQRKGISIGLGASHQKNRRNKRIADSLLFKSNASTGLDLLFEMNFLKLDASYYYMFRGYDYTNRTSNKAEWHVRFSMRKLFSEKSCLQTIFMLSSMSGTGFSYETNEYEQMDIGCNLYFAKTKCKIGVHYIHQNGHHECQKCNFFVIQTQLLL